MEAFFQIVHFNGCGPMPEHCGNDPNGQSKVILFPVSLRNQLASVGLEPVLSHTEKNMYRIVLYKDFYEY